MFVKSFVVLCCIAVTVLADEKYTNKYDNLDINDILENPRLLEAYFNCIMEKGKCTPEGNTLKTHMVDALQTGCEKCTDAQKKGATTVIHHLIKNNIEMWKQLCEKFDPEGKWRKTYEERAKANGIDIPSY